MRTGTNRRRTWHPAVVAAVIASTGTILGGVLNAVISNSGRTTVPGSPIVSPVVETITTTTTPAERRAHFVASFRGSTVEGDVTWPDVGTPRVSGMLNLEGSLARSSCSLQIVYEVHRASGESIGGGNSTCVKPGTWPKFAWNVPLEIAAEAGRIDIFVQTIAGNDVLARIQCVRSGGCGIP